MKDHSAFRVVGLCDLPNDNVKNITIPRKTSIIGRMVLHIVLLLASVVPAFAQISATAITLDSVHKIYIEKMGGDLDQYLRAEFIKQAKGRFVVVLDTADADAVLTGSTEEKTGVGHAITGRYLGLEDNTTAAISLVDPSGKQLLWATEAGDRSLILSVAHRGGERKVAERVVNQLLKAARHYLCDWRLGLRRCLPSGLDSSPLWYCSSVLHARPVLTWRELTVASAPWGDYQPNSLRPRRHGLLLWA